ncbi:MAG TPA: cyclic nucleotide-gated ion channel [Stellaceae bacterium]|jgi:voltage-gated potassium channel|nr:cyclic nucleotide-gated ion channel [Stellaceae bacterium]
MTRKGLYRVLNASERQASAEAFRVVHHALVAAGIMVTAATTVPAIREDFDWALDIVFLAIAAFFAAEFILRLIVAPEAPGGAHRGDTRARLAWLVSFMGIFDLLGALPGIVDLAGTHDARLFSFVWIFKYIRYTPGLGIMGRVFANARPALLSVLLGFVMVLLAASSLEYLFERHSDPVGFGSIPKSLWWAIVTLTTTGYGDVVPQTLPGRMLAGMVMMSGILVFALWAGILASGYADETRRSEFLRTWDLVAKVPFFHELGAPVIAEVARALRPREYQAGAVIMRRGESGDCMYFVVDGEVEIEIQPAPVRLGPGTFFGEAALLTGDPRNASVLAARTCTLLSLDIVDFRELLSHQPELSRVIHEEANRRLGRAPAALVDRPEGT